MSSSSLSDNGILQIFSFSLMIIWNSLKLLPHIQFMAIYLFSQILKFTLYSIKLIKKLSRRHLINSSDVFVITGFTVHETWETWEDTH